MLDIKLLRETPEVVKADLRKRGWDPALVDHFIKWDNTWRAASTEINEARAERNAVAKAYGPLMGRFKKFDNLATALQANISVVNSYLQFNKEAGPVARWLMANRKRRAAMLAAVDFCVAFARVGEAAKAYDEQFHQFFQAVGKDRGVALQRSDDGLFASLDEKLEHAETLRLNCVDYASIKKPTEEQINRHIQNILSSPLWPADDLWTLISEIRARHDAPHDLASSTTARVKDLDRTLAESQREWWAIRRRLPNIMHDSVPVGKDDRDNVPIKFEGTARVHDFPAVSHVDLLESLDVADLERAARAAGARFVYLKGDLVLLAKALEFFALTKLTGKGFTPVEPPFMLRREAIEGAVDLSDFEDVIYKVEAGAGAGKDDAPELFLIATSEHPLAALHMGEIFEDAQLPLRYAGVSPCFRKEAGAHGKDTKGIFRVHQFSKVEQFVYCTAEDSWAIHEELIANAEEIYRELGIPYRVVNICTGDLGTVAAKKYDIEAWMPVQGAYREVVSCSNCTDYQARRYNTRHRKAPGEPTSFVHTLNSTAVAVQRTLVAILENFQQADGSVMIPEPLRQYLGGRDRIRPAVAPRAAEPDEAAGEPEAVAQASKPAPPSS